MPIKELLVELDASKASAELRAKRRVLSRVLEGLWTTLLKGRGMEFAGYRQYTYGDDASRIDWNATLRGNQTLVREYEEYKTVNVFFMLDLNDSMLFTTQEKLKCEYAAELMFHFAKAVTDIDDAVGYALYTNDIMKHQLPTIGMNVITHLEQELSNGKNYGGDADFKRVMMLVSGLLRERSLIVIISDFVMLPIGWELYIKSLSTRFDLIGIMVRDPRDSELAEERTQAILQDPMNENDRMLVDFKQYAGLYEDEVTRNETYVESVFGKAKAGFLKIDTTVEPLSQLIQYFKKRARIVRT